MDYVQIVIGRQEYEERVRWLRSLYGSSNHNAKPSRVARLAKHMLYMVGKFLVSLGERMQPRHEMPITAPVVK